MTEFHAQLRARARESARLLQAAQDSGDDYAAEMHRADLENIARIAREHDVALPEIDGITTSAA